MTSKCLGHFNYQKNNNKIKFVYKCCSIFRRQLKIINLNMRFNFRYVVINLLIIKEKEWILTVKPKLCQNIFRDKSAE